MKKVTRLKDLAEGLGVSITTVSKALNDHPDISAKRKKRDSGLCKRSKLCAESGCPKSSASSGPTWLGLSSVIMPTHSYARVIRGIEETLSAHGYHCVVMNSHEDVDEEIQLVDELRGLNVAGVILTPAAGNKKSCELLRKYDIPYVLVNRYLEKGEDTYVVLDDYQVCIYDSKAPLQLRQ